MKMMAPGHSFVNLNYKIYQNRKERFDLRFQENNLLFLTAYYYFEKHLLHVDDNDPNDRQMPNS